MSFPPGTILDPSGNIVSSDMSVSTLYEGASTADRMGDWGLSSAGPTQSLASIGSMRTRARTLERNNPTAMSGINSFVSNLVGTDISPVWNLDNEAQREELSELWEDSQQEADFYGISDFYGSQEIVARSVVRDGESLARFHDVHPSEGLLVPLQVQTLEADHLDVGYNDFSPEGNEIRFGIEWLNGRRYKYWLYRDHPGESFLTGTDLTRVPVPASDLAHVFRPLRAGQSRGMTWLSPCIVKFNDIDIYDDAEVMRKKAAALLGGFIYTDKPLTDRSGIGSLPGKKVGQAKTVKVNSATFLGLRDNERVSFSDTVDVGNNYLDFMRTQMRLIASGLGITYEQLTGDLEGVNYTSLRAALIEFRRLCETIIARTLIFQYNRPYINRWIRAAVLNNCLKTISAAEYMKNPRVFHRVDWNLDGWDFTDPLKDRMAEKMDIRNGLDSRGNKIAKRGGNIDRVDKKNKAEMEKAVSHGLAYDCYPSQTTNTGIMQKVEEKLLLDAAAVQ